VTLLPARYRFRPRFRGFAWSAGLLGAGLLAAALGFGLSGASLVFALLAGAAGITLSGLYALSPAWRIVVAVDEDALEVLASGQRRFRLRWDEIERVVASPSTKTCFVDGGSPARSLLLPGPGAQAPYTIEDRGALYDTILARAPKGAIEEVALLREAVPSSRPQKADETPDEKSDAGQAEGRDGNSEEALPETRPPEERRE
jgi:hypothetical protein